ncbi:unnamed protein product [Bemisia tabaci]|uniref:CCHC-type domain-containing protein n=1 Tax=Bemisia tabaci TaxID=7038 RepID=A0A9P0F8V4_BEMTA|nr:unnamed protein product [Bemisia tabaci]
MSNLSKHRVEQLQSTPAEVNVLNEQSSSSSSNSNRYSPSRYGRCRSPLKPRWSYSPADLNCYSSRSVYPYERSRNSGHRRSSPHPRYYRSRSSSRSSSRSRSPSPRRHIDSRPKGEKCSNCGQHHHAYICPAHGRTCNNCGKLNHFARYCPEKKLHYLNVESSDDDILFINNITCSRDKCLSTNTPFAVNVSFSPIKKVSNDFSNNHVKSSSHHSVYHSSFSNIFHEATSSSNVELQLSSSKLSNFSISTSSPLLPPNSNAQNNVENSSTYIKNLSSSKSSDSKWYNSVNLNRHSLQA